MSKSIESDTKLFIQRMVTWCIGFSRQLALLIRPLSRKVYPPRGSNFYLTFCTQLNQLFTLANHPHPTRYVLLSYLEFSMAPSLAREEQSFWSRVMEEPSIANVLLGPPSKYSVILDQRWYVPLNYTPLAEEPFLNAVVSKGTLFAWRAT